MDDALLIAQSKQGDSEAFNRLVVRYQGQVFTLAYRMLGDRAAAEDATQETFLSAYQNIHSFHEGNFRAWLLRIAVNACRDHLRSGYRRKTLSLEGMAEEDPTTPFPSNDEAPEDYALRRELREAIAQGLKALPPDQRLAILLVDVQGLSYEEAAQVMGVPIGTVKSRLSRARLAMRTFLLSKKELLPTSLRSP
ncbi:MAG: sigma-70 family RNA polymerase sigma factor [Dehalococcoidia bacterium]|nr:sigma-70 family RNA polymerase sigma factor [Dehalococcoidia bacterium]MDW8120344.1 sigma-70 family RNA polymerase sigma factor [Chloroflexota bacterium]